jgi:predicted DNA-binding transcriptional regulator AlpA
MVHPMRELGWPRISFSPEATTRIEDLPRFLGELESIRAVAWSRLTTPSTVSPQAPDELLDIEAAAERLGVSKDYLYRHNGQPPFSRRIGRKLLFSSVGIDAFIRQKRGR